jgi:diguanylate cyclase (GGDEF)-like protein
LSHPNTPPRRYSRVLAAALTTTTVVLLAVGAGVALLTIVVSVVVLKRRRSHPSTEGRIASVVADLNTRMNSMMRDLGQALEVAEEESRRLRLLSNLVGSIDFEEVLERTLQAAGGIPGADASVVCLRRSVEGKPVVASLGLAPGEADLEGFIAGPPAGRRARAITLSYRYDASEAEDDAPIRGGLAVPLTFEGELSGHLAVFTRSSEIAFGEAELAELEELAQRAGPAIENARRFEEARQLADLDALTGLHNRRYFHATLVREVSRAHRYGRQLALIVLDLDDFKAINDRVGHLAGDAVLAAAAERMREVVRAADIACRVGGDEFALIMPESTVADAEGLSRRIQAAFSSRPVGQVGNLHFSAGIAELRSEDDAVALFQRADDALYEAKGNGKRQITAAADSVDGEPDETDEHDAERA